MNIYVPTFKSYDEWRDAGFSVNKGEKSYASFNNVAQFDETQVTPYRKNFSRPIDPDDQLDFSIDPELEKQILEDSKNYNFLERK